MPNYAEINHASAEFRQNWECRHAGRTFGNAEMLWLWSLVAVGSIVVVRSPSW